MSTAWRLVSRYWFDALVLAGAGVGIYIVFAHEGNVDGPEGPVWLDAILIAAIVAPFLLRRRFGFWALAAVPVIVAVGAALDGRLVPDNGITFLAGFAVAFLFGQRRDIRQATAGLALIFGAEVTIEHYDPRGTTGDIFFSGLNVSNANATKRPVRPLPKSVRASRASCTTSSGTASAS